MRHFLFCCGASLPRGRAPWAMRAARANIATGYSGRRGAGERGADVDLGAQRAMHGAHLGDLEKPRALRLVERADKLDRSVDAIDHRRLVLAIRAILGMHLRVPETDDDMLERQSLPRCVKPQRHR